jgi:hypothetical protein
MDANAFALGAPTAVPFPTDPTDGGSCQDAGAPDAVGSAPFAPADGGAPTTHGLCSSGGWCWLNPLPLGNALSSVSGTALNDVWAVGEGALLHFDGAAWSYFAGLDDGPDLYALRAIAANDVWAAGKSGRLLHFDGARWSPVASGVTVALLGLWASGPKDVWAVGDQDTILHFDGAAWTMSRTDPTSFSPGSLTGGLTLEAVWGSGPNDVWASGGTFNGPGLLRHFDGKTWTPVTDTAIEGVELRALWGSGPNDVWAAGTTSLVSEHLGNILHFDGATWAVAADPGGDLAKAGVTLPSLFVNAAWGSGANDVWFVGTMGDVHNQTLHWDGKAWSASRAGRGIDDTQALWGSSAKDIWAVGSAGQMLRWSGAAWSDVRTAPLTTSGRTAVWGSAANDVWISDEEARHWNGATWSVVPGLPSSSVLSLAGTGADNLWAVGRKYLVARWNGSVWTTLPSPVATNNAYDWLQDVWSSGPDDAWVVGTSDVGSVLAHWDGCAWNKLVAATPALVAVWGSDPRDVWAASRTSLLRWDGAAWTERALPSGYALGALRGTSARDVWAVGYFTTTGATTGHGVALHFDGVAWKALDLPMSSTPRAIWPLSPTDAWIVGTTNASWHWDGVAWSFVPTGATSLGGVWAAGPRDVWAVGAVLGTIVHLGGT